MKTPELNLANRGFIHEELRREVVGPDPRGEPRQVHQEQEATEGRNGSYRPWVQVSGEEVLRDPPSRRYGAGVLFPKELRDADGLAETAILLDEVLAEEGEDGAEQAKSGRQRRKDRPGHTSHETEAADAETNRKAREERTRSKRYEADGDNADLADANGFRPSAMGLSFVVDVEGGEGRNDIEVRIANRWRTTRKEWREAPSGWYRAQTPAKREHDGSEGRAVWLRSPLFKPDGSEPRFHITLKDLREKATGVAGEIGPREDAFPGKLSIRWVSRRWPDGGDRLRLVTATLVNDSDPASTVDRLSLFQAGLVVTAPAGTVQDYPRKLLREEQQQDPLDDELVNRVLYANRPVRAVGHGCGVDWAPDADGREALWTDVMPAWEMSPMAFDVRDRAGETIQLPMRMFMTDRGGQLADDAIELLKRLVDAYASWVERLDPEADCSEDLRTTAREMKKRCEFALERMRSGIDLLTNKRPPVARAFALANRAMLMAQHQRPTLRSFKFDHNGDPRWEPEHKRLDLKDEFRKAAESGERPVGHWRPFQLAFLLMSLEGAVDGCATDRETVDLIWFPTGGGKTEAYLGLTAFTVFHGLLTGTIEKENPRQRAVCVLMRYTLRLLTSQQFERAVRLFCAMELIRSGDISSFGKLPLQVGLWVGGGTTPNRIGLPGERDTAAHALRALRAAGSEENPFVLLQCPWCGAPFGHQAKDVVHGYQIKGVGDSATLEFKCSDPECEFGPGKLKLPAQVVDECLYRAPPVLLIGTVDKFAMLAWRPEIRAFFGIDASGGRVARPPHLIIQDEMHLITGPLGTMVGLYETVIEALCLHDDGQQPKIIASTATAARAEEQVRGLFARKTLEVFPPPGLDAADSFFAREDHNAPGRLYVGVLAPGHGSMQTTQRHVYGALAQAAADVAVNALKKECDPVAAADPWWTLLCYYNSLRELGGALTLFGADIPDQLGVLRKRRGLESRESRRIYIDGRVMELTSRLQSGEVPGALRDLEKPVRRFTERDGTHTVQAEFGPFDACLATNIIEVGVDVPRLALMAIVGQPKTTSSYIQASSRVGRREDRPGLVVMMYSTSKPRDRSHYERFRAYHEAIYSWVEPTSVTPFSPPVIDRALHAVIVALLRQTLDGDLEANATVQQVNRGWLANWLESRAAVVGREDEKAMVVKLLDTRLSEWRSYNPERFGSPRQPDERNAALMYPAGSVKPVSWREAGWPTPTSLRAVDATCEVEVTGRYAELDHTENEAQREKD